MLLKDNPHPAPLETYSETDILCYGKNRWRRVQHLSDVFWNRQQKFYINDLQRRSKWFKDRRNIEVGDVVIIKDKLLKRNMWKTGVVEYTHQSKDNIVRSCSVRTPKASYRRAVKDLVVLVPVAPGNVTTK